MAEIQKVREFFEGKKGNALIKKLTIDGTQNCMKDMFGVGIRKVLDDPTTPRHPQNLRNVTFYQKAGYELLNSGILLLEIVILLPRINENCQNTGVNGWWSENQR